MSLTPKDMDFIEAKAAAARDIALAFGVPPLVLGLPGDNTRTNYVEANLAFWRGTVIPTVARLQQSLSAWLGPQFGGDLRFDYDVDRIDALQATALRNGSVSATQVFSPTMRNVRRWGTGQRRPKPPDISEPSMMMHRAAPHDRREIKHAPLPLAGITATGIFEGYASLFDTVDLGRDVVTRGAFADSLRRSGPVGVKMLWQHDAAEPIGSWSSIAEDARGLKVRGQLNLAVARAREILALMRAGSVDGLSIGFRTKKP